MITFEWSADHGTAFMTKEYLKFILIDAIKFMPGLKIIDFMPRVVNHSINTVKNILKFIIHQKYYDK